MADAPPQLELRDVRKHFPVGRRRLFAEPVLLKAVDGISLTVAAGETLGLVGESGCGKSTTGRLAVGLLRPSSGDVRIDGTDASSLSGEALRLHRRKSQFIFQDPFGSLNPRMTVERIVAEPLAIAGVGDAVSRRKRVLDLLDIVGLAAYQAQRHPHEFSGGQRQRIGIARALALNPKFVVCDEPVSALDVSVQAQVLNLMIKLQRELGLSYLFIAHDLAVVRQISDRIAVMYLGKIVEVAERKALYDGSLHPYTQALLSAVPISRPGEQKRRIRLTGDVPTPVNPPSGCRFHTRCPLAFERCRHEEPKLLPAKGGRAVACHLVAPEPQPTA